MMQQGNTSTLLSKVIAEMIGTFAMVFAGCGSIMVNATQGGQITHLGISMVFGLVVMVMIYAAGHISGAHFNPAVTIGFTIAGCFPWREVPAYIVGQCLASMMACLVLLFVLGDTIHLATTQPSGLLMQSFVVEILITFFLMFVIMAVATDGRSTGQMAGLAIGSTVVFSALWAGPISGASMNPARTLGPALVSGQLLVNWIYLVGPILGAVTAAWVYQKIRCDNREMTDAGGCC